MKFKNEEEKQEKLGPVYLKAFGRSAIGKKPKDAHDSFTYFYIIKVLKSIAIGLIKGHYKPNPFFHRRQTCCST